MTLTLQNEHIKSVTISGDVGFCKPNPEIYAVMVNKLDREETVVFVDDQEKNLRTATEFGWQTLLADAAGAWISQVDPLLLG